MLPGGQSCGGKPGMRNNAEKARQLCIWEMLYVQEMSMRKRKKLLLLTSHH